MELDFARSALEDMQAIQSYFQDEGVPEIDSKRVSEMIEKAQRLTSHPLSGREVPEFGEHNLRELIHPPYRVVYLVRNESLTVVRVWRSERLLKLP